MEMSNGKKLVLILLTFFITCAVFMSGVIVEKFVYEDSQSTTENISEEQKTLLETINLLAEKYYYGEDSEEYKKKLIIDAIDGMVDNQGNPYTDYMSADEIEEFYGSLVSGKVGIGVYYSEVNDEILVLSTILNSPAQNAGIQSGDYIIGCDGVLLEDVGVDKIIEMIAGTAGSEVTVSVDRGGEKIDFTMKRESVLNTVQSDVYENVGILSIESFSEGTLSEAYTHLQYLTEKNIEYLVIDLRSNTGGYAYVLDELSALFMDEGDIIMIEQDRDGQDIYDYVNYSDIKYVVGSDFHKYEYKQIVIITNKASASCSEVFTMAMKENCNALVVGTTTYGKGEAQASHSLSDGSALKYTDLIWMSGNRVSVAGEGITPDVEVWLHDALYEDYLSIEECGELKPDCVNLQVLVVQLDLDFLGYDIDRNDGYFSSATANVISQYQKDHDLSITGTINEELCTSLNAEVTKAFRLNPYQYDAQLIQAIKTVRS